MLRSVRKSFVTGRGVPPPPPGMMLSWSFEDVTLMGQWEEVSQPLSVRTLTDLVQVCDQGLLSKTCAELGKLNNEKTNHPI